MDEEDGMNPEDEATRTTAETAADPSQEPEADPTGGSSEKRVPKGAAKDPAEQRAEGGAAVVASLVAAVTEPVVEHVVEPLHGRVVGPMAGALGTVLGAANQAWSGRDAIVSRRLRRRAKEPLASLYELYPEARFASPHELGLRFVPLEEIRGTAVAGAAQRGGDFLPLKPFRSTNWEARWNRIRQANDRLIPLPPVDLVKFDGDFWVVDGHNRVATALYADGAGLDAMVTELVPLDGQTSERPSSLLSLYPEAIEMRAAAQGLRPAMGMRYGENWDSDPTEPTADSTPEADN
jgi:hypothetical protein